MKMDYHIHSKFSSDSNIVIENLILKAIKNNYKWLAFTDHFDFLPSEMRIYGVRSYNDYIRTIDNYRQKYSDEINLLTGVEVGEYHRVHDLVENVFGDNQPDLQIASIHVIRSEKNLSNPFGEEISNSQIKEYYEENLEMVEIGDFDILGHLGIYKRYLSNPIDENFVEPLIEEIFLQLIKKEIALEINTSGLRKTMKEFIPEPKHLQLYLKMGGRLFTLGSDSHNLNDFDHNFDHNVKKLKDLNIKEIAVKNKKKWQMIKI